MTKAKKHSFEKVVSSKKVEWFTPPDLAQRIKEFLGEIDLDPCADPRCSTPALRHEIENGLGVIWRGRVFINPPYGRHIKRWIDKALSDPLDEAVLLVPSNTATQWFQPCFEHAICFLAKRLVFSGAGRVAPFPSVLVYRGPRTQEFKRAFSHMGHVVIGEQKHQIVAYQLPLLSVA